jgi:hypothetical protein
MGECGVYEEQRGLMWLGWDGKVVRDWGDCVEPSRPCQGLGFDTKGNGEPLRALSSEGVKADLVSTKFLCLLV